MLDIYTSQKFDVCRANDEKSHALDTDLRTSLHRHAVVEESGDEENAAISIRGWTPDIITTMRMRSHE